MARPSRFVFIVFDYRAFNSFFTSSQSCSLYFKQTWPLYKRGDYNLSDIAIKFIRSSAEIARSSGKISPILT